MRHLIRADPQWAEGDYYGRSFPVDGLNAAVAAAVPLWMSREAMETRFGRRSSGYRYTLGQDSRSRRSSAGWWPRPGTNSTRTG